MGDLIKASVGAANATTLSMSFWFNSPNDAQILDCTGLYYSGHLIPASEDHAWPSIQASTSGTGSRTLVISCGNPAGMDTFIRRWVETDGEGSYGFAGATSVMSNLTGAHGTVYASFNSTGPTTTSCPDPNTSMQVVPNPIATMLPFDGLTYFDGVAVWGWMTGTNWGLFAEEIQSKIDTGGITNPNVLSYLSLAQAWAQSVADATSGAPGTLHEDSFSLIDDSHADPTPAYPPPPICTWISKDNACAVAGSWNHAAIAIDTGHAGPYAERDVYDNSDPKRAVMVINGVFANLDDTTEPRVATSVQGDGVWQSNNFTTSFSMDFSSIKLGIPYLNSDRVTAGLTAWPYVVRMANLQIWPGQYIDWRDSANFSKVVTINGATGTPAPLADASTAFGTPTIRCSGNHLAFPINTGSGGAFTQDGTITDFTPTASY